MIRTRSSSVAEYNAAEKYVFAAPIQEWANPGSCLPALFSVGYSGDAIRVVGYSSQGTRIQFMHLAKTCAVISIDAGGTSTFANDTAIAAVESAVNWYTSAFGAGTNGRPLPILLVGTSMGFGDLMAWARTRPGDVIGAIGTLPLVDLTAVYNRNPDLGGGTMAQTAINAAYGGTYVAGTHGPTHNPVEFADELTFPIKLFYSTDDPLVPTGDITAFQAAAADCTTYSLGAHAHNVTALEAAAEHTAFNDFIAELRAL